MTDSNKQTQKHASMFCALFFRVTNNGYKVSKKFTNALPSLVKDKNSQTREEAIFILLSIITNDHKQLKMAFTC